MGKAPHSTSPHASPHSRRGVSYRSMPADVRDWSRVFLLDFCGIALGAAHYYKRNGHRLLERYLDAVATPGPCTVLGCGVRTTPGLAAFANGTLAEALDFQDSNMDVLTHNSTPIIPAALALGEQLEAPWGSIAAAMIAGYEVHTRLLATLQPGHWYRGFQGLGTFGTCGAAVAAGKLLGLDTPALERALGCAGAIMPVSSSDNVFKAHTMKACIPGQAAQCGVSAAYLARAGYDGAPLEGEPPSHHAPLQTLSDGGAKARARARGAQRGLARAPRRFQALPGRPPDRRTGGDHSRHPERAAARLARGRGRGYRHLQARRVPHREIHALRKAPTSTRISRFPTAWR